MDNKNFFLAILLSVAFLFSWSLFVVPHFSSKPATPPVTIPPPQTKSAQDQPTPTLAPAHHDTAVSDTILRDSDNEITVVPQGGAIRHWRLVAKGHEIDLVNNPDASPLPLATFPESEFKITQEGGRIQAQTTLPNGLKFVKTLILSPHSHLHELTYRFDNPTGQPIEVKDWSWGWGPGLGTAETERKENSGLTRAMSMGKLKAHQLKAGATDELGEWAGVDNRYFLVAFLPVSEAQTKINVEGSKELTQLKLQQSFVVPAKGSTQIQYQLYAGPKGYTQLRAYKKNLEAAVDFGFFGAVGKVILKALYRLQNLTGNYGWAIILLTLIIQVLILPLTIKQTKSLMAMKKMQPQIQALQKAYKSDQKRLNIEMMNLYKKSGANPLGGCLPMLLQLPIFWALFTTLRNAYELRGAPFMLWIKDLSAPESLRLFGLPVHFLPIVMGATMYFQQKLSGASADPTQRQMMYMMPIMFTVMFYNFPAGVALYWFINSLASMSIQAILLRGQKPSVQLAVH